MTWVASTRTATMGVRVVDGGDVQCLYNPAFVAELTVLELFAVIQHEVEHVVRCHCIRHATTIAWNIAADMTVNGPQSQPRIGYRRGDGTVPEIPYRDALVWIPPEWPLDENTEYYYRQLKKEESLDAWGRVLDDHTIWADSDVSPTEYAEVARAIAEDATEQCQGHIPGHLTRVLQELARPQLPWHVLLQRYVRAWLGERRTTYLRRSRRNDLFGMPGRVRRQRARVSVIVDVSGSVSQHELSLFFTELERICVHARMNVLLWDAEYQGFTPDYRPGDWTRIPLYGGGGTDMAAPVDWLVAHRLVGDCVILLTDGYCNWPDPASFPLIAVLSHPDLSGPPWGKVLRLAV